MALKFGHSIFIPVHTPAVVDSIFPVPVIFDLAIWESGNLFPMLPIIVEAQKTS